MKNTNIVLCANGLDPRITQIYIKDKIMFPVLYCLYKVEAIYMYEDGSVKFKLKGLERRWSSSLFIPYCASSLDVSEADTEGVVIENQDLITI